MIVTMVNGEDAVTNAVAIKQHLQLDASMYTIRRHLQEAALHCKVSAKKQLLTEEHLRLRLRFALNNEQRDVSYWSNVVFADE